MRVSGVGLPEFMQIQAEAFQLLVGIQKALTIWLMRVGRQRRIGTLFNATRTVGKEVSAFNHGRIVILHYYKQRKQQSNNLVNRNCLVMFGDVTVIGVLGSIFQN